MDANALSQAKEKLRIPELWKTLGLPGTPANSCPSPLREDKNPSFSIYDEGRRWKDFATGEGGDAIDFLARVRGLNPADAIREFKRLAGVLDAPPTPPRPQPPSPKPPPAFDWAACVAAFAPDQQAKLAEWRSYAPRFVAWLQEHGLLGLFDGERIALPVHDGAGLIIACHYRRKEDGSWRYYPTGTHTAPLVIGDLATAKTVFVFESQWDGFATMDAFHWHIEPLEATAIVATRGAANGKLLRGLCAADAIVYAFPQNDPAGSKWLADLAAHSGRKTFQVLTPAPHKDTNDWTRAGAVAADIRAAITAALPVAAAVSPELQPDTEPDLAAAPAGVSQPVIVLQPEDEPDPEQGFPMDALPSALAGIIAATSRCQRTPPALPALCALGVCSAAISAGLESSSGPNRVTKPNLFLLGSAESGSGKSEAFRIVAAPLLDFQTRSIEAWKLKDGPRIQAEIGTIEVRIKKQDRCIAKTFDPAEIDKLSAEKAFWIAKRDELIRQAPMPAIIASDVTTERLAGMLRDNREQMFSTSADARKLVDNLLGRYNPGKTTDESLYLAGYSGDFVKVDRQSQKEPIILHHPCLTLLWMVQPDLLASMVDERSLSESGFLPRCLMAHTHATPRRIEGDPQGISEAVRSSWANLINSLLNTYHATAKPYRIDPTPEAQRILDGFFNAVVDRRSIDLADVGSFAARWAENAWRMALVLHAALHGADAHLHPLDAETARNAVKVVEWFSVAQLDILAKGRRAAAEKLETEVLELLETNRERKALDFVTARDVHRARIVASAESARALLARMETAGIIGGEDVKPEGGGKTTRIFRGAGHGNPVPG